MGSIQVLYYECYDKQLYIIIILFIYFITIPFFGKGPECHCLMILCTCFVYYLLSHQAKGACSMKERSLVRHLLPPLPLPLRSLSHPLDKNLNMEILVHFKNPYVQSHDIGKDTCSEHYKDHKSLLMVLCHYKER